MLLIILWSQYSNWVFEFYHLQAEQSSLQWPLIASPYPAPESLLLHCCLFLPHGKPLCFQSQPGYSSSPSFRPKIPWHHPLASHSLTFPKSFSTTSTSFLIPSISQGTLCLTLGRISGVVFLRFFSPSFNALEQSHSTLLDTALSVNGGSLIPGVSRVPQQSIRGKHISLYDLILGLKYTLQNSYYFLDHKSINLLVCRTILCLISKNSPQKKLSGATDRNIRVLYFYIQVKA